MPVIVNMTLLIQLPCLQVRYKNDDNDTNLCVVVSNFLHPLLTLGPPVQITPGALHGLCYQFLPVTGIVFWGVPPTSNTETSFLIGCLLSPLDSWLVLWLSLLSKLHNQNKWNETKHVSDIVIDHKIVNPYSNFQPIWCKNTRLVILSNFSKF